jgi:hypothetical protein
VLAPSAHPGGPLFSLFFPEGTSVKAALAAEFLDSPKTGTVENSDDDRCFRPIAAQKQQRKLSELSLGALHY